MVLEARSRAGSASSQNALQGSGGAVGAEHGGVSSGVGTGGEGDGALP